MRRLALGIALCAVLALPGAAAANYFYIRGAQVSAAVQPDGSLLVAENLDYGFSGKFEGAYRDIPLKSGQEIDQISVAEGDRQYRPGASAELGSSGDPDTFGVARLGDRIRIVWHYRADSESRIFTVRYRFRGLAVAYDDVVDINWQVWGDQWKVPVYTVAATVVLPTAHGGSLQLPLRVWGHPADVKGTVDRKPGVAVLSASKVPPGRFVELRTIFPRSLLDSTAGAQVRAEPGLTRIVAEERKAADDRERGRRNVRWALDHLWLTIPVLILIALGPALLLLGLVFLVYGREPRVDYDREYEQEPPSDLPPALVLPLIREEKNPVSAAQVFTATLFDLIRRGRFTSAPTTTEDKTDLLLAGGGSTVATAPFEEPVTKIIEDALEDGPVRLTKLGSRITAHRASNAGRFRSFLARLSQEIGRRKWFVPGSGGKVLGLSVPVLFALGLGLTILGASRLHQDAPRWGDVLLVVFGVACFPNLVVALIGVAHTRLWLRRRPEAQLESQRWLAFRRYLTDFPRLEDAQPATLALWESYLVYGIAFGIAERVLQEAHLRMPTEYHEQSSLYWISSSSDLGSGPTSLGISRLTNDLASALRPPMVSSSSSGSSSFSSSSGFGGSFSSSGGGGGGGGGGGAW